MASVDPGQIDLLVLDVDGVLTDGRIVYDAMGGEIKAFSARDGAGLKYWHRLGKRSAILTGRTSEAVTRRAAELGMHAVRQGVMDKLPVLREILAALGVPPERTAYMGDDLPDIPPMRECGLAITVPDAVAEVKTIANWVSPCLGGHGAVRWAIEKLLRAGGLWDNILKRYQ
ncbi:MAG: HAD hydrolase family protein [Planctomycetes bacterium]|nr:HAD hydrolase family protein [Planctomycetota bacterium]